MFQAWKRPWGSPSEIWTVSYLKKIKKKKGHIIRFRDRQTYIVSAQTPRDAHTQKYEKKTPLPWVIYISRGVVKLLSKLTAHCVFGYSSCICFPSLKLEVKLRVESCPAASPSCLLSRIIFASSHLSATLNLCFGNVKNANTRGRRIPDFCGLFD